MLFETRAPPASNAQLQSCREAVISWQACSDSQRLYIRVVLETSGDCRHGRPVPDMLPGHLRRHCEASASVNTQRFRHPMAGGSAGSARRPKEAKNAPKAEQGQSPPARDSAVFSLCLIVCVYSPAPE